MDIVELKIGEESLCKGLRLRALQDAPDAFSETYEQVLEFDDTHWKSITNSMLSPNQQRMFIAKEFGNHVGSVYALIDKTDESVGRLGGMWVETLSRNRGIGQRLFNRQMEWAMDLELKCIRLWVQESENSAKSFYVKLGFTETGIKKAHLGKALCEMQCALTAVQRVECT